MPADSPTILATSAMGFNRARSPWRPGPVFQFGLNLAGGGQGPRRVCWIGTAGGDDERARQQFYDAFADTDMECQHLPPGTAAAAARGLLLSQDMLWVERGNVLTAVDEWRSSGIADVLRECWEAGVVLAGESAGSLCWFESGTTDASGDLAPFETGLGFLPGANVVHYRDRREHAHQLVASGVLNQVYAMDDGAGLHFRGTELVGGIRDRSKAGLYQLAGDGRGGVRETAIMSRRLRR